MLCGLVGGLLGMRTGIPAAPLAGALLGAGLVSHEWRSLRPQSGRWERGTCWKFGIGTGDRATGLTGSALT